MFDAFTLPRLDMAPFWSPVSLEDYGAMIGQPTTADDLPPMDGWQLGAFSACLGSLRRRDFLGWVRSPFAISELGSGTEVPFGQLHHLPTGHLISTFADAEVAAFGAAVITPLADWQTLMAERIGDLPERVLQAYREAGFDLRIMPSTMGMRPVWFREIGELN